MKCCTPHDSCAVLACAKFCSIMMLYNGITLKPISHLIWIAKEKSFMKWASGLELSEAFLLAFPQFLAHPPWWLWRSRQWWWHWLSLHHSTLASCIAPPSHPAGRNIATLNMLNCLKIRSDVFTFRIISLILSNGRRPNSQWSNPMCSLFYTVNTMSPKVARASAGMVLTPKAGIFHLQHQES